MSHDPPRRTLRRPRLCGHLDRDAAAAGGAAMSMTFKPGDRVWWAHFSPSASVAVPCPVCNGKRAVVLILGNDDQVTIECGYCSAGFDSPRGTVTESEVVARAELVAVTSVTTTSSSDGTTTAEYTLDGSRRAGGSELFLDEVQAQQHAEALAAEHRAANERTEHHRRGYEHRSFGWKAGYHMREAARAHKDAEYHERMAAVCKARARTPVAEP